MTMKFVVCSMLFLVALTPAAWEQLFPSTQLSTSEMSNILGGDGVGVPLCMECELVADNQVCGSPWGTTTTGAAIHDLCTYTGCISGLDWQRPPGILKNCGIGRVYTGNPIQKVSLFGDPAADLWRGISGTSHLCDYDIVCETGDFDNSLDCRSALDPNDPLFPNLGACVAPGGGPPKGCRTCAAGPQTFPLRQRNLADEECVICPF